MPTIAELPTQIGGIPIRYQELPLEPQRYGPHPSIQGRLIVLPWYPSDTLISLRDNSQFLFFHNNYCLGHDEEGPCTENDLQQWFGGMDTVPFLVRLVDHFVNRHPLDFMENKEAEEAAFYARLKPSHTAKLEKIFGTIAARHGSIWATPLPYSWDELSKSSLMHRCPVSVRTGIDSCILGGKHQFTGKWGTHSQAGISQAGIFGEGVLMSGERPPLELKEVHYLQRTYCGGNKS